MTSQLDYLDEVTRDVLENGDTRRVDMLSTGERLYVALAASRMDIAPDFSIAQALSRIGPAWTEALVARWEHKQRIDNGAFGARNRDCGT